MLVAHGRDLVVPPQVAPRRPVDLVLAAPHDEHLLDRRLAGGEGSVDGGLERQNLALAVRAVGGDDELGAGIVDAGAQALGREAAEHDGVHGAEPRDGEHGDDGLRNDRQVDRDAIALADAEAREEVGGALDLDRELGVGEAAAVAGLALPVDRDAVAVAREHVPVEAVVGDVELTVTEPAGDGGVRPVERFREGAVPVHEVARLLGPEREAVLGRALVELGPGDRARGEVGVGGEAALLVQKAVDRGAGHHHP